VHHILEKLALSRRTQAMYRAREAPWIASPGAVTPANQYGQVP